MIADWDYEWLICTPAKCGSSGLRTMCMLYPRFAENRGAAHAGSNPERDLFVKDYKRRILLARDPLERIVSGFWFLLRQRNGRGEPQSEWQQLAFAGRTNEAFFEYTEEMLRRSRGELTRSLYLYVDLFNPHDIVFIENLSALWDIIGHEYRARYEDLLPSQLNVTEEKKSVAETVGDIPFSDRFRRYLIREYEAVGLEAPAELEQERQAIGDQVTDTTT